MDTSVPFAVPGEGVGHRVTPDHEKDKGRAGSQQHHEPGEADPTSRLHMTDALSRHLTGGALQECAWLVRAWFLDFSTKCHTRRVEIHVGSTPKLYGYKTQKPP